MRTLHKIILAGLLFAATSAVAAAQTVGSQPAPVQYIVAPDAPGPNSLVNIEVEGVGNFLGNSTITWQQNGKTVASGVGVESYSFTTGGIGTRTTIDLTIDSSTEGTITHEFTFYPSLINLVWEADTTAPPLYLGKPLYSAGSPLRVVAFPLVESGGALVPASALSYQWQEDGTPVTAQSGLGASVLTFDGSQIQSGEDVSVDAYYGATKVAHGEITIPAVNPQVLLYVDDPLRGELIDQALGSSASLTQQEVTLQAEPYYFAQNSAQNGALQFSWTLDGQPTSGPDSAQGVLTLRQTGSGTGQAQVGVSVQNTDNDKYVQQASAALDLVFGEQAGSSISSFFGL